MKKFFSNLDSSSMISMKSLYSLINNHFFKSIINPFFSFLFPIIFVAILGSLLGYSSLLGGLIAMPSMTISLLVLPLTIFEFKNSVLLKRIAVTNIKTWMFLFAMISYYFLITIISTITTILLSMALFSQYWSIGEEISSVTTALGNENVLAPSLSEYFTNAEWGGIIWGIILNSLVGSSIGFLAVSFSKSSLILQGILIPILILSQFLSAMVLPIAMIKEIDAIWYLTYISPFRYSSGLINESFNGIISLSNIPEINGNDLIIKASLSPSLIFDVNSVFSVLNSKGEMTEIFGMADKIINLIMPFVISLIFMGISLKTFKWSTR
ncbi:MAG: hypothetical protein ACRDCD_00585 [Mycoplasmoidaceae bacterium]